MARPRLPIVPHLSPDEIARRYRACRAGVEKTHWQVLWLLTRSDDPAGPGRGRRPGRPDPRLGPHRPEAVERRGARRPGRPPGRHQRRPAQALGRAAGRAVRGAAGPPRDGGLWTGPKVAAYVRDRWGVAVCVETGWRWLNRPGVQPPGAPAPEPGGGDGRRAAEVEKATWPTGWPGCAATTPARPSSCGPRMRPGWGSSRSPAGSGPSRAGGRRPTAARSTSGCTSTGSSTRPAGGTWS